MLQSGDLVVPPNSQVIWGIDTGTYMSAVAICFPPESLDCFIFDEFPNYRYVGGEIELLGMSIPEWARQVKKAHDRYEPNRTKMKAWADPNSQFKTELQHYHINLLPNFRKLELRCEISREYIMHRRVHLAPWLKILPWELEHAMWPDDTSSAGKFERVKQKDHTLDCMEHVLSRRPRSKTLIKEQKKSFLQQQFDKYRRPDAHTPDIHLGLHR